jgi:hypothetical protein
MEGLNMFYLIKFSHEGKSYFLYRDGSFVGGNSALQAKDCISLNLEFSIKGKLEVFPVENLEHLKQLDSEYPFKIIDFHGGLVHHFEGVLLKE